MRQGRFLPVPTYQLSPGHWLHPRTIGESACRAFAWIDLVALAAWKDTDDQRLGEVHASVRFLADRWGWSRGRVQRFLDRLERGGCVSRAGHKSGKKAGHKAGREPGRIMINDYTTYVRGRDTKRDTKRDKEVEGSRKIVDNTSTDRAVFASFIDERKRHVPDARDLKPTTQRLGRIRARLDEGLSRDDAEEVARGIFYADNHIRDGFKYSTIDVAFRSLENCERFQRAYRERRRTGEVQLTHTRDELHALTNGNSRV